MARFSLLGVILGVAGASFAVALPLASRWYPPQYQGVALGIAGAGNSGTVLAALFAPALAAAFGWINVIGLAAIPLTVALVVYLVFAKDSPDTPPSANRSIEYATVLREPDAWWFMFYYAVTFGGFSGLASSLGIYFNTQYGLEPRRPPAISPRPACSPARWCARSAARWPIAIGGIRVLTMHVRRRRRRARRSSSFDLPQLWLALGVLFIVGMLALGMGNGAVFQLVPQRFRAEIGVMTGLVGMTGGIGGFYLASSLGFSKQLTGSYQFGLS